MAGSNKGLIAVLAGGASLGLGVGLFYLFVWSPKQDREKAQQEVGVFSDAWAEARGCLLEGAPDLADGEAAYLALESRGVDEDHLASCDAYLYDMKREGSYSTGDAEIEGAWRDTVPALRNLAKYIGLRVADEKRVPLYKIRTELAAAIREMDRREAALRVAADLDPIDHPGGRLKEVKGAPLEGSDGSDGDAVRPDPVVSGGRLLYRVHGEHGPILIRRGQGLSDVIRGGEIAVPASSGGWGLWLELDGEVVPLLDSDGVEADLMVGNLDEQGDPAGEGAVLEKFSKASAPVPQMSLGRGQQRIALYRRVKDGAAGGLIARVSNDGGASWEQAVELPEGLQYELSDLALERLDFVGQESPEGPLQWLPVYPGSSLQMQTVVPPSLVPAATRPGACFAGDKAYWLLDDALYVQPTEGGATPIPGATVEAQAYQESLECDAAAVAMASQHPGNELRVLVCSEKSCDRWLVRISSDASFALAVVDGKAHLVTLLSSIAYYYQFEAGAEEPVRTLLGRFEGATAVDGLAVIDGALQAVARSDDGEYALYPVGGKK